MSTCTKWVDTVVISCHNWSWQVDGTCTDWADEGSNQCTAWKDEGSNQCSQWADEGHNACSSWDQNCHWYTFWNCIVEWVCHAWYWVANIVCQAWYWVANIVCQAWYWVAKWVCKAFAWVVRALCTVGSWFLLPVCVVWDTAACAVRRVSNWFTRTAKGPAKIQHVFVLMMENRSFDHMFGFSGITGVDPNGMPTAFNAGFVPNGNSNVDPATNLPVTVSAPADFALDGVDKDPAHEFLNTFKALVGPAAIWNPQAGYPQTLLNSGFIQNYIDSGATDPGRIMRCFSSDQLPVLNALATEFAICDMWFSSLPGPTWPNRFFAVAATSGGLDDSPSTLATASSITLQGYRFQNGNIFDLLDENCISWRIFEGDDFPVNLALDGMTLNDLEGRFKDFDDFASELNKPSFNDRFVFIEPKYGAHEFDVAGPGDFTCGNSMHPLDDVTRGEWLVKKVYETIRSSPVWEKSLLLICFDEHGGFYDHVSPPRAVPPGDLVEAGNVVNQFQFDQLGVRVPAIVVSPFTPRNVIDHTVYDHTSMLATLEQLFGLSNLTMRDQAAHNFLHLVPLTTARTDTPPTLPDPAVNPNPPSCNEDTETEDDLMVKRSELRRAKEMREFKGRPIEDLPLKPSQIGFLYVALLRILETAEYPERQAWIAQYESIRTGIDASLFMVDAKLKLRYAVDMQKARRQDPKQRTAKVDSALKRRQQRSIVNRRRRG